MNMLDEMRRDAETTEGEATVGIVALAEEMADLRDELRTLVAHEKEARARYDEIRKELLPDAMESAGLVSAAGKGSFTMADGRKVFLQADLKAYVRNADEPAFFEKLRERGDGSLIRETVHHGTLRSWVKEQRANGNEIPEEVQIHDGKKAVIRKS